MPVGIAYRWCTKWHRNPTIGHSFYEQSGGTWSALILSSVEYAWIMRAIESAPPPPTKTLNLKLYLEGLYNTVTGLMNQAQGLAGPEFGPGIADQITVELHNASHLMPSLTLTAT